MAKTSDPITLTSGIELATYYTANNSTVRPLSPVRGQWVDLGRYHWPMGKVVEALDDAFNSDEEELKETIALGSLKQFVGTLAPELGGTIYDREEGIKYLRSVGQEEFMRRMPQASMNQFLRVELWPYHDLGLGQRLSRYDFGPAVVHIMTNTELQDSYTKFGMVPTDPRLSFVESVRAESVAH